MGNNYDQYFGKDKRKIVVLGLQAAGKTTLVNYIVNEKINFNSQSTKNLNIVDKTIDRLHVTFFDLGGSQRQRIFWRQQYQGTQGIIFVIDTQKYESQKTLIKSELTKLAKNIDKDVPFCICLNKVEKIGILGTRIKNELQKDVSEIKKTFRIFELDFNEKQQIKQIMSWLLKQTKPL